MKEIALTQGKVAIVDDEDYEFLNQFKWHYKNKYAARSVGPTGQQKRIWMHDIIMPSPDHLEIDHINRNGLDNRKSNLRIVTHKENADNRGHFKNNTSGYKGVSWHCGKWQASYRHNGVLHYLGRYDKIEDAHQAYLLAKENLNAGFRALP